MRSSSLKIEEDRGWKEDRMDCGGRALSLAPRIPEEVSVGGFHN